MPRTATLVLVVAVLASGCAGVSPPEDGESTPSPTVGSATPDAPEPSDPAATGQPTAPGAEPANTPGASDDVVSGTAAGTASARTTPPAAGDRVSVVKVVDGDTLKVRYRNGSSDTVRLLGVDTPEVHVETTPGEWEGVPDSHAGRDCLRAAGHDASAYVKERLAGETVRLTYDENAGRRGYYGRLLAYVHRGGEQVNYRLVVRGHARVYDSNFVQRDRFYAAEEEARAAERGAWRCRNAEAGEATPTVTATATPASTSTSRPDGGTDPRTLEVVSVREDAPGNDHENENGEYVVFENTGEAALDLSGWTVADEADHTYRFPRGFVLDPGAGVTLYTGSGEDTADELYWGSDAAIWNNGGDTVFVRDAEGETVEEHRYS